MNFLFFLSTYFKLQSCQRLFERGVLVSTLGLTSAVGTLESWCKVIPMSLRLGLCIYHIGTWTHWECTCTG